MIITIIKLLHSIIFKIFFLILTLFIISIFFLSNGIEIPKIDILGYKVEKFYIKLDKKLIITINKIEINDKKEPTNKANKINFIIKSIQYLPNYFKKIEIDSLKIGQKKLSLLYERETFYIDTNSFRLSSHIFYNPDLKTITVKIKRLLLKNSQIELDGKFDYLVEQERWIGEGSYKTFKIAGNFYLTYEDRTINFKLNSKESTSIKELVDYIAPPEPIKVWIYPKIPAKRYKLHYLTGTIKLKRDGSIEFDPKKLKAFAVAYDAKIYFHNSVPPVSTKQIDISLENNTLSFKLYDPLYEGKKLNGSFVQIRNLTNSKAELDAHIIVNDKIDNSIKTILSAYEINLPFIQTEGKTSAVVDFTIKLSTGEVVKYEGDYRSKYAKLLFDKSIELPVKDLHVISNGSKLIIEPCNILFTPYLNARVNGSIDLHNKTGNFKSLIKSLKYTYNSTPLIKIADQKFNVEMSFNDKVIFKIPKLNLTFSYRKGGDIKIVSNDIKPLIPYLKGPLSEIKSGKIDLNYSSKRVKANGFINYSNNYFKYQNKPLEKFNFKLDKNRFQTVVSINNNIFITLKKNDTYISLGNIDIYIDKILKILKNYTSKSSSTHKKTIHIKGYKATLHYKKLKLPCSSYSAIIKTNPLNIIFTSKHDRGKIMGVISNKYINITGKDLPDYVIRNLTTLKYIYGGYFDFEAIGNIDNFKGRVLIYKSLWAKNAFYNNIFAALNTIPAVLSLKNPGFSKKGFKIKKGAIQFSFKDNILYFKNILMKGDSAQITGKGKINFKSETILMLMQIHFLENLTNILNKIPIAGYIIFGDDGTMAVSLNINGYLDNPKVKTEVVKDIIQVPFNILERTIKLPFKLFELNKAD